MIAIPNTYIDIILQFGPNLLVGIVSATYCGMSIQTFASIFPNLLISGMTLTLLVRRRKQFNNLLSFSHIPRNRYTRLMILCCLEISCTIPLNIYLIVLARTTVPSYHYIGMEDLHLEFSRIGQIPAVLWSLEPDAIQCLTMQQWLAIACGLVFFGLFGLSEEACAHYRSAFNSVAKKLGYSVASRPTGHAGSTIALQYALLEMLNCSPIADSSFFTDASQETIRLYLSRTSCHSPRLIR
jgi:pheromone a factor receptor